jgi:hypothetical protein
VAQLHDRCMMMMENFQPKKKVYFILLFFMFMLIVVCHNLMIFLLSGCTFIPLKKYSLSMYCNWYVFSYVFHISKNVVKTLSFL